MISERYYIKDKTTGNAKAVADSLELHDEWMDESFVTVDVNSPTPIDFGVDDYLEYRGDRYVVDAEMSRLKQAGRSTYGDGFAYRSMKLVDEAQAKAVRCNFIDIVLGPDNEIHYTMLPTFPFYCETVDDFLDRIQACLEDLYPGKYIIIGLNSMRNRQRGLAVGRHQEFVDAYRKYVDADYVVGNETTEAYGKTDIAETVDNIGCWDAFVKVHDDFDVDFIHRGYVYVFGVNGVSTKNTFRYGKGNGLVSLESVGGEERVVTRLTSYGSDENLPVRYYATLNMGVYGITTTDTTTGLFSLDLDFKRNYFTNEFTSDETSVVVKINDVEYDAKAYNNAVSGKINVNIRKQVSIASGTRVYFTEGVKRDAWPAAYRDYTNGNLPNNLAVSRLMLPGFPSKSLDQWVRENRPELISEGFSFSTNPHHPYIDSPNVSKYGIRPANIFFDGGNDYEKIAPTIEGMVYPASGGKRIDVFTYAEVITDDGVLSEQAEDSDKNVEVWIPYAGFDLSKLWEANKTAIEIKGGPCGGRVLTIRQRPKLKNGNWICQCLRAYDDLLDLYFPYNNFPIIRQGEETYYVLTGIELPDSYVDAASVRLFDATIEAMRDVHELKPTWKPVIDEIWMAREEDESRRLGNTSQHDTLKAGDVFLFEDTDLNINTGIVIDTLTIRENGNNGIPTYDITLREEKQASSISRLLERADISANGGGSISSPNQMAKLVEAKGKDFFLSRTSDDEAQGIIGFLKGLWVKAKGLFGFDQDGNIKANNVESVGDTVVGGLLTALKSIINHAQSDNYTGGELTGTGWRLTADDGSGHSKLEVDNIVARMKFVASVLEARKYVALGGNYVYSPAASIIERVDYIKHYEGETQTGLRVTYQGAGAYEYTTNIHMVKGQTIDVTTDNAILYVRLSDGSQFLVQGVNSVEYTATEDCDVRIGCFTADTTLNYTLDDVDVILGYETLNMPWILRKMPMWMASKLMSRKKMVKTTVSDEDKSAATMFRCWIKADDGTTSTVNTWQKGMLARCQTMDVSKSENGTHTRGVNGVVSTKNTYYWREVVGASSGYLPISDGMIHSFVDLSNAAGHYDAGSDLPSVGDSIVCFGATKKQYSNIIVIETVGTDAPAFKEFRGVGLQDITRDNTSAELPRFSTEGRQFTKISPSTGNDFYAPHFYIETINGTEEVGDSIARLRVDMNGIESTVTNLSNQNLLTGLADGEGWWHDESDFDASHVKFSSKGEVSVSIDGSIATPSIELPAGQYTFSCIGETSGTDYHFTVYYFEDGQWSNLDDFDFEEGEDIVFTFSLTVQRIIQIGIYTDLDAFYISYPKLEYGTIATSFNMDSEVNYSRIRQTAESIELKVKNTGIDIDQNEINLTAGKVNFLSPDGETANPNISIDPATGELNAKGGNFEQINVDKATITGSLMLSDVVVEGSYDDLLLTNQTTARHLSLKSDTFIVTRNNSRFSVYFPPAYRFPGARIRLVLAPPQGTEMTCYLYVQRLTEDEAEFVDVQGEVYNGFVNILQSNWGVSSLSFSSDQHPSLEFISTKGIHGNYYQWMLVRY